MGRLYHYTILGALCQLEFPENKGTKPGEKEGDPPVVVPFERGTEDRGSLHLAPNSSVYLTADELEVIRAQHPDVAKHLRGPLDAEPTPAEPNAGTQAPAGSVATSSNSGSGAPPEDGPPNAPPASPPLPPARGKRGGNSDE